MDTNVVSKLRRYFIPRADAELHRLAENPDVETIQNVTDDGRVLDGRGPRRFALPALVQSEVAPVDAAPSSPRSFIRSAVAASQSDASPVSASSSERRFVMPPPVPSSAQDGSQGVPPSDLGKYAPRALRDETIEDRMQQAADGSSTVEPMAKRDSDRILYESGGARSDGPTPDFNARLMDAALARTSSPSAVPASSSRTSTSELPGIVDQIRDVEARSIKDRNGRLRSAGAEAWRRFSHGGGLVGALMGAAEGGLINPAADERDAKSEDLARLDHQFDKTASREMRAAQIEGVQALAGQREQKTESGAANAPLAAAYKELGQRIRLSGGVLRPDDATSVALATRLGLNVPTHKGGSGMNPQFLKTTSDGLTYTDPRTGTTVLLFANRQLSEQERVRNQIALESLNVQRARIGEKPLMLSEDLQASPASSPEPAPVIYRRQGAAAPAEQQDQPAPVPAAPAAPAPSSVPASTPGPSAVRYRPRGASASAPGGSVLVEVPGSTAPAPLYGRGGRRSGRYSRGYYGGGSASSDSKGASIAANVATSLIRDVGQARDAAARAARKGNNEERDYYLGQMRSLAEAAAHNQSLRGVVEVGGMGVGEWPYVKFNEQQQPRASAARAGSSSSAAQPLVGRVVTSQGLQQYATDNHVTVKQAAQHFRSLGATVQ